MTSLFVHGIRTSSRRAARFAPIRLAAAAAALSACAGAGIVAIGGDTSAAMLAALVALAGVATGRLLGQRDSSAEKISRDLMLRVADELIQYRAFTRLLRDQGNRVVETTGAAAMAIIEGINEMDVAVERLRMLSGQASSVGAEELRSLAEAIDKPAVDMLGQLQFQDVTQQQIEFLSRLSLILDNHLTHLASQLGDRRAVQRLGRFREMFEEALNDCVMDSQRDDHHAAAGFAVREDAGVKLELF